MVKEVVSGRPFSNTTGSYWCSSPLCRCSHAARAGKARLKGDPGAVCKAVEGALVLMPAKSLAKVYPRRNLLRGVNLRQNFNQISLEGFVARKTHLTIGYKRGDYLKDPESKGKPPANPMTDPAGMDQMLNMLKGNMAMMVPQTLIMGWINAYFSGFIISTIRIIH